MRCGNIRIHVEIPVYADKNNCFCDDNHVSYSIPAIREACETASNLPIIQYDEQGTEKVVGVAQSIKWNPHGFIEVDGLLPGTARYAIRRFLTWRKEQFG